MVRGSPKEKQRTVGTNLVCACAQLLRLLLFNSLAASYA